tara:strand:+ start:88 stop:1977 length:1890 start_codon:yes stop_codon:yes gene_type:complete
MAGKDQTTAIIVVVVIMMVTILAIGSGWYILSGDDDKKDKKDNKKSGECAGPDVNAVYQYDDDENCVRVGCKTGYYFDNQFGFCVERRNYSEEIDQGTDCVIDGYTLQACELKVNGICGEVGGGKQLREPNKTADAIGSGSCEAADYVDCVVPCPETCKVADEKYTAPVGAACMAGGFVLGVESGYCGTGTKVKTLNPNMIDLEGTGFTDVQEYLEYANPNDICSAQKSVVSGPCKIDCVEGLADVGCGAIQEQEYIKDVYGNAVCFDKEETEQYIRGELLRKPTRLPVILAADVRKEDGTYDVEGNVVESLRKGLHILYRSDQGISFENMVKNDCTLYSTEACQAPRQSVNCVIGITSTGGCLSTGCERLGRKTLSYGITTHPFGSTEGVPNACPPYEAVGYDSGGCQLGGPCPVDCVQTEFTNVGGCVSDGMQRQERTTETSPLHNGTLCGDLEQFVECSFGNFDRFNNDKFYIKGGFSENPNDEAPRVKNGIYLGLGPQISTAMEASMSWLRTVYGDERQTANKDYLTLDGPLTNVSIKAGQLGYCSRYGHCNYDKDSTYYTSWKFEKQSGGGYKIIPNNKPTQRVTINNWNKVEIIETEVTYGSATYPRGVEEGWDDVFYLEKVP